MPARPLVLLVAGGGRALFVNVYHLITTMYRGKHYLSIQDLKFLMGTENNSTAYHRFNAICEAIHPGKTSLTIREFCRFEGHDFDEIWGILRPGIKY